MSYSLEILSDATGDRARPHGAYLLFVRWSRFGAQRTEGHLESEFLTHGQTADEAERALGAMTLADAQRALDALIDAQPGPARNRRRLDVLGGEPGHEEHGE